MASDAAEKLRQELAHTAPPLPSILQRPPRKTKRDAIALAQKFWEDEAILIRLVPETRAARTGVAIRQNRLDVGDRHFFQRQEVWAVEMAGLEALRRQADPEKALPDSSAGIKLLHLELSCASVVVKRLIGSRYEAGQISGIEMIKYARGLTESQHAVFMGSRIASRAIYFCESWGEYEALLLNNPHLDARYYDGIGTYLIVILYEGAGAQDEVALYVGAVWDQAMAEKQGQHVKCFEELRRAKASGRVPEIEKVHRKQPALYRRKTKRSEYEGSGACEDITLTRRLVLRLVLRPQPSISFSLALLTSPMHTSASGSNL